MSFSFNFVIDEDPAPDAGGGGGAAAADDASGPSSDAAPVLIGTTVAAATVTADAVAAAVVSTAPQPDLVPGKRLLLDAGASQSLELSIPSAEFAVRLADGTQRKFMKVDEERAEIGHHLLDLLFDDDTRAHKDLVPRQYEGGLKVWEASLDLVRYLHHMNTEERHPLFHGATTTVAAATTPSTTDSSSAAPGPAAVAASCDEAVALPAAKHDSGTGASGGGGSSSSSSSSNGGESLLPAVRVLELGCGHGFPGLYVLQEANVRHCAFTDYNEAVLRTVTWPTVLLNAMGAGRSAGDMDLRFRARYYAGDWDSVSPMLREDDGDDGEPGRFELILTAETLYTPPICSYVERLLRQHLSHRQQGTACALVAAKRFYFGTGGSTAIFKQAVADGNDAAVAAAAKAGAPQVLHVETVDTVSDGLSNIRDILKVTWATTDVPRAPEP